uniref:Uncharacterized protein n=1 Tax=Candidatus Methanophaga sp. ANME-1 ERB7 TaxID=2759913 RepID=A0A7G9Z2Z3_9EURY|nr:hypothetical protein GNACHGJL_00009 [Methanosarcinales archaeon ANME-1 ERB7]
MLRDTKTLVKWWEKRIGDKSVALKLYVCGVAAV